MTSRIHVGRNWADSLHEPCSRFLISGVAGPQRDGCPVAAVAVVAEIAYLWVRISRAPVLAGIYTWVRFVEVDWADNVGLRRIPPQGALRARGASRTRSELTFSASGQDSDSRNLLNSGALVSSGPPRDAIRLTPRLVEM